MGVGTAPRGHEAVLTLVALGYGTGIVPDLVLRHSGVRDRLRRPTCTVP